MLQVLYKHKIIVFGGFYDTLREVRLLMDFYNVLKFHSYLAQDFVLIFYVEVRCKPLHF